MVMTEDLAGDALLQLDRPTLQAALKAAGVCVFMLDLATARPLCFENAGAVFGQSGESLLAELMPAAPLPPAVAWQRLCEQLVCPDDLPQLRRAAHTVQSGAAIDCEARLRTHHGQYIWCKLDLQPLPAGPAPLRVLGTITNIHPMKTRLLDLQQEVHLDSFTRLYGKPRFETLCTRLLQTDPNGCAALIMLDLDNFKAVNDRYGHQAGDAVLLGIARHLQRVFRRQDIIARYGGDEFTVLMPGTADPEVVRRRLEELQRQPDNDLGVTKSAGVALYPAHGRDYQTLLHCADAALYRAKQRRNSIVFWGEE